jgi:hypothetical protein
MLSKHNYEVSFFFRTNESMDQRTLRSLNSRTTEEYEDTKGVIKIRKSKDRQHNDRKNKQRSTKKYT